MYTQCILVLLRQAADQLLLRLVGLGLKSFNLGVRHVAELLDQLFALLQASEVSAKACRAARVLSFQTAQKPPQKKRENPLTCLR